MVADYAKELIGAAGTVISLVGGGAARAAWSWKTRTDAEIATLKSETLILTTKLANIQTTQDQTAADVRLLVDHLLPRR